MGIEILEGILNYNGNGLFRILFHIAETKNN